MFSFKHCMNSLQTIKLSHQPTTSTWIFEVMEYNGYQYSIEFDGSNIIVKHGKIGGILQPKLIELRQSKRTKTKEEQALLQCKAKILEKYREGYRSQTDLIIDPPIRPKPMLAFTYKPSLQYKQYINECKNKNMKKDNKIRTINNYPTYVSDKIDGKRLFICLKNGKCWSREGVESNNMQHIVKIIEYLSPFLPEGSILDGEIKLPGSSFNETISIANSKAHSNLFKLNYYIFDIIIPHNMGKYSFDRRYKLLNNAYSQMIDTISSEDFNNNYEFKEFVQVISILEHKLVENEEQLINYYNQALLRNNEGIMINDKDAEYAGTRSARILKYKPIQDEEGTIIDIECATGEHQGCAIFVVKDIRNNIFRLYMKCNLEQRREQYTNKKEYIGKEITYWYQELSEYGVPRFPVGKSIKK